MAHHVEAVVGGDICQIWLFCSPTFYPSLGWDEIETSLLRFGDVAHIAKSNNLNHEFTGPKINSFFFFLTIKKGAVNKGSWS